MGRQRRREIYAVAGKMGRVGRVRRQSLQLENRQVNCPLEQKINHPQNIREYRVATTHYLQCPVFDQRKEESMTDGQQDRRSIKTDS